MDRNRGSYLRKKRIRQVMLSAALVTSLAVVTGMLMRLEPALPTVDRSLVWIGRVERGPMVLEVSGAGKLVPEEFRWVSSSVEGRIERIFVLAGSEVYSDSVLIELENPELERDALGAELELHQARAELTHLRVELQEKRLAREAEVAAIQSEFQQSRLQADLNLDLAREGLISKLNSVLSQVTASELENRYAIEQKRLTFSSQSVEAQIDAKKAEIARLAGISELKNREVQLLKVRAGIHGVLQEISLEVGQRVNPGDILGRVAVPGKLKAQLRIPETQAGELRPGLPVRIDTRNGVIDGKTSRIDPAVEEGTVTVDVTLEGALPIGARPDLNVDGLVELDRVEDTLQMKRPAYGKAESAVRVFKLVGDGQEAVQVRVNLGRSSVSRVQILAGLEEGDQVILSDTSDWDRFERIRLN